MYHLALKAVIQEGGRVQSPDIDRVSREREQGKAGSPLRRWPNWVTADTAGTVRQLRESQTNRFVVGVAWSSTSRHKPRPEDSFQMKLHQLVEWLSWFRDEEDVQSDFLDPYYDADEMSNGTSVSDAVPATQEEPFNNFIPVKKLCERDLIIIDMLNSSAGSGASTNISFCITDPSQIDNPIVFASDGFYKLTGYSEHEVLGRNCRFLQGPHTDRKEVVKITQALMNEDELTIHLTNYKKDGTPFRNEFYLANLRSPDKSIAYFIGLQSVVDENEENEGVPSNPGCIPPSMSEYL